MFDSLAFLLFAILLVVWLLDYLGVIEIFSALLELIGAVIAAVLRLATMLIRKVAATRPADNVSPGRSPPSPAAPPRGYTARFRGSRRPPTD